MFGTWRGARYLMHSCCSVPRTKNIERLRAAEQGYKSLHVLQTLKKAREMAQFETWRPSPKPRSPFAPQASPCTNIKSQSPRSWHSQFLLFLLTVSQQRTPDLRLFSLARKSGMFQCTSNTRYLVMPPSTPSLKQGVEPQSNSQILKTLLRNML